MACEFLKVKCSFECDSLVSGQSLVKVQKLIDMNRVRDLIRDHLNKPVLYRYDRQVVLELQRRAFELDPSDVSVYDIEGLINYAHGRGSLSDDDSELYESTYYELREEVLTSHVYSQMLVGYRESLWVRLQEQFIDRVPLHLLERWVSIDVRRKEMVIPDFDAPIDVQSLLEAERNFFTLVQDIPLGLGYAERIMAALDSAFSELPLVKAVRFNTIADLGDEVKTDFHKASKEVSEMWYQGFRSFRTVDSFNTMKYTEWYNVTMMFASLSEVETVMTRMVFPLPTVKSNNTDEALLWERVTDVCAPILAAMWDAGIPEMIAIDYVKPIVAEMARKMAFEQLTLDMRLRRWLWGVVTSAPSTSGRFTLGVSWFASKVRNFVESLSLPLGLVNSFTNAINIIALKFYEAIDLILGVVFQWLGDISSEKYSTVIEYFYLSRAFTSSFLPEARRRPKAVWALLFTSNFTRLTPGEKFALSCAYMDEPKDHTTYAAWAKSRLELLKNVGVDIDTEPSIPIRKFRIPDPLTVPDEEITRLAPLAPEHLRVNEVARDFSKKILEKGVPQGIDNALFADKEHVVRSIQRYDIERPSADDALKSLILQTVHALADKYPDMYRNSTYLTPQAALNKVKVKFSPGLPFIPKWRDRKELKEHGILDGIARAAEHLLIEGTPAQTMFHSFAKSNNVNSLQKYLDGKNIRTVTASDLLSNLMLYVTTLETTRRQPALDTFVMNAVPRSEGGFRAFYDKLKTFSYVFQADAKEFDSKLAPVITSYALPELRSLGYDGSLVEGVARTQIYAAYIAMRFAKIIDLTDGEMYDKNGGLGTGQGNTSPDNRDSFRITWIAGWAHETGRHPSRFWDTNVIGNAGDDDAIGTNEPEHIPGILRFVREQLGIQVIVETIGFENLALVGLRVGPVEPQNVQYYTIAGIPVPSYSIHSDRSALLLKRSNWSVRTGSFTDVSFHMHHLDGVIGSAYLTAHINDVYEFLAEEYLTEVQIVLLRFFDKVVIEKTKGDYGELLSVFVHLGSERPRYVGKTGNIRLWLKGHRFPNYADVMRIHLRTPDPSTSKMHKDHQKIFNWLPRISYQERALYGVITMRETLYKWIPTHVAKSLPEFTGLDPTYIMKNTDYVIAKFTWLSLYHASGKKRLPKAQLFRVALRENPYGSAEDPVGFLDWLSYEHNLTSLLNTDLEELRAQMMVITLFYWFAEEVMRGTRNIPGLAILFNLYALTMRDINRVYAALNYAHMIATGRSSPIISNLMPPDPYLWVKQFAVICSYFLPRKWYKYMFPGLKAVMSVVPAFVEAYAVSEVLIAPKPYRHFYAMIDLPAIWSQLINEVREPLENPRSGLAAQVIAPTGTGKSTAAIAAIFLTTSFTGTIWVLCPTIAARDAYQNDFLPADFFQILSAGVVNVPSRRLKVLTNGHAATRLAAEIRADDLIVFDEVHLAEPALFAVWFSYPNIRKWATTATPSLHYRLPYSITLRYPGGRRFQTNVKHVNMDFPSLITEILDKNPLHLQRALIVVPTIAEGLRIVQTLSRLSINSTLLSSVTPDVPPTGIIVATTIVDTAINIEPPPTCLIDFGQTLQINYDFNEFMPVAIPKVVPTGPSAHRQRLGRVGRKGDSIAYLMPGGGSNVDPPVRLTPFALLFDLDVRDSLLAVYRLGMIVEPISQLPNLLSYVSLNPYFVQDDPRDNDLALALWIFLRHSDYQIGTPLREEWQDLRIEKSEHEILNLVMTSIRENGYGDPLRGNFDAALDYLRAGALVAKVSDQLISCAGLCIRDGYIMPMGLTPEAAALYSVRHYTPLTVHTRQHFRILGIRDVVTPNSIQRVTANECVEVCTRFGATIDWINPIPYESHNVFQPTLAAFVLNLSRRVSRVAETRDHPWEFLIPGEPKRTPLSLGLALVNQHHEHLQADVRVGFSLLARPEGALLWPVMTLHAASLPPDSFLVHGACPLDVIQAFNKQKYIGCLIDKEQEWAVIASNWSRFWLHEIYTSMRLGVQQSWAHFNSLPLHVYRGNQLAFFDQWASSHQQMCLSLDGNLVAVLPQHA